MEIEDSNRKLDVIYDLFLDHRNKVSEWDSQPWSQVDIAQIEMVSKELVKKLDKMGSEYQQNSTYEKLKEDGFAASVPALALMKKEFIRQRHWDKLLKEVGAAGKVDIDARTSPSCNCTSFPRKSRKSTTKPAAKPRSRATWL